MAAHNNLIVHLADAISAYLAGSLDEKLYMEPPEGYDGQGMVCRLLKSLYGLKQSARIWNHKLRGHLIANGYRQLHSDYGLYFNGVVLIAAYVDDMAIAGPKDLKDIKRAKQMLESEFDIKDLGECRQLLGMEVMQGPGVITIRQQGYIEATLREFGLEDCKPVSTPMEPGRKLVPATEQDPRCDREQYQRQTYVENDSHTARPSFCCWPSISI